MTNPTHPRERLIQTAAALVHQQGWTATGINQILSDAGIPKGSFYYYFRSKEALGSAILKSHGTNLKQLISKTLMNSELTTEGSVDEFFKEMTATHQTNGYRYGCPIGSFANEIATQSVALLEEANIALKVYEEGWTALLQRGQNEGSVSPTLEVNDTAKLVTAMLQGAFLSMKCAAAASPLELAYASISKLVFGTQRHSRVAPPEYLRLQALAS